MGRRVGQSGGAALRGFLERCFRDRQILLRSESGVRGFVVTARLQKVVAGIAAAWLLLAVTGVGALIWQQDRLTQQARQLDEQHTAYAEIHAEVSDLRDETHALLSELDGAGAGGADDRSWEVPLPHGDGAVDVDGKARPLEALRRDLSALMAYQKGLSARVAEIKEGVRGTDARLGALARSRAALSEGLAEAEAALEQARAERAEVSARLSETRKDLRRARAARLAEVKERLSAENDVARMTATVESARERESTLQAQLDVLERRIAEERRDRDDLLAERRELAERVGHLERAFGHVSEATGEDDLAVRIANLDEALRSAERRGERLERERSRLESQVADLTGQIAEMHERQSGLFEHFTARTRNSLERLEDTVEMTGLDVDQLVARVRSEEQGRGGPFVPVDTDLATGVGEEVQRLGEQMERMAALQAALASLPLTAPVDSYWISSYFGNRRDPLNNQWAKHQGIDLAASKGTPVLAAAPGTVVFAGRLGGFGRLVEIDHGYGITTFYAHLQSIAVDAGDRVEHREEIGKLGSSGRSTGPHLHYEVRVDDEPVDPMNFLKAGRYVFKG